MSLSRRTLLYAAAATAAMPALRTLSLAQTNPDGRTWRHGLSLFGELRYPADFKHFDYVNPGAPKAGSVRLIAGGQTFDNLNLVVSGVKGNLAAGIDLIYDSLMVPALDEVSAEYG